MTWLQAIILGIVEGLTEYLPVSSTGHLILAQRAMGIAHSDAANAFAVCIQAGAILAVLGLYWRRVWQVLRGWAGRLGVGPGDADGTRLGVNLVIAFIPAAVVGLLCDHWIEQQLFGLWPIVAAWFVGGVAILAVAWRRKQKRINSNDAQNNNTPTSGAAPGAGGELTSLTWRMALAIGVIQCLAMWPGTSRSLVTIVAGVLVGMRLAAAVEFSFLLGVITLLAATMYKALLDKVSVTVSGQPQDMLMLTWMAHEYGWPALVIGEA